MPAEERVSCHRRKELRTHHLKLTADEGAMRARHQGAPELSEGKVVALAIIVPPVTRPRAYALLGAHAHIGVTHPALHARMLQAECTAKPCS